MEELEVFITAAEGTVLPDYRTAASSGMDLRAHLQAPVTLKSLDRSLIPTGIRIAIPDGYEAQVRPRSGLAAEHGITVLNTPGTIDADYRGELKVIVVNLGTEPYRIEPGDRIAQLVFQKVVRASWKEVGQLPDSERGSGGFGSTGKQ